MLTTTSSPIPGINMFTSMRQWENWNIMIEKRGFNGTRTLTQYETWKSEHCDKLN